MNSKASLPLLLLFCIFLPVLGQNPPAPPSQPQQPVDNKDDVVKITTNLVQVDVVVTKDGKPVANLTADDFEIFEDGRRQTITSFAYISNVPASPSQVANDDKKAAATAAPYAPIKPDEPHRTIAFVVDDLGLSAESMGQVRKQLRKFIAVKRSGAFQVRVAARDRVCRNSILPPGFWPAGNRFPANSESRHVARIRNRD